MIRDARPADRPTLARLQSHLAEQSPELLEFVLTSTGSVSPGEILVSTDEGEPVGYLLATHGEETHIAELVVAPDHRREGRASALLTALFDRLPDDQRVTVTVAPENQAARALYAKYGFRPVKRLPDFFDDGSAVLLARE